MMTTAERELVLDELHLMKRLLPVAGSRVVDIGCGAGVMAWRMMAEGAAASVTGLEVDSVQHEKNRAVAAIPGLFFMQGSAESIPCRDASFDIATMFKSLHHVPVESMDAALVEIARVLSPRGLLYVSEPVFAGEFNEIVRVFHDEERVRAEALAALGRAVGAGRFEVVHELHFDQPLYFPDFADFEARLIRVTFLDHHLDDATLAETRRRFESHVGPDGARFIRPMRVNLLRRR